MFGHLYSIRRDGVAVLVAVAALALAACGGQSRTTTTASPGVASTVTAPASAAAAVEQQFVTVVKETQPQVVQIQTDSGLGSGVIYDTNGNIVTNAHVVGNATQLVVTLADGRRFDARRDPRPPGRGSARRPYARL